MSVAAALPLAARVAAGVAGLGAVVFGVLAIFEKHDGAATAVLLVIGAAFCLMAITGYAITRIKAGDYEVTLEAAVKRAQLAYAGGDEERAEAIVRSLVRQPVALAPRPSRIAWPTVWRGYSAVADANAYERMVLDAVVSVVPDEAELLEEEAPLSGVDAFIEFPERTRIGIDIRAGTRFDLRAVADRISAALTFARPELAGLIVIVRAAPDDARAAQLRTLTAKVQAPVEVVAWAPGDRSDAIRDAIIRMIPRVR